MSNNVNFTCKVSFCVLYLVCVGIESIDSGITLTLLYAVKQPLIQKLSREKTEFQSP